MCYNGFEPGDTEDERETVEPWETEGDLAFLPPNQEWRLGPMGPEEKAFREMLEADDDVEKPAKPPRNRDDDTDPEQ